MKCAGPHPHVWLSVTLAETAGTAHPLLEGLLAARQSSLKVKIFRYLGLEMMIIITIIKYKLNFGFNIIISKDR